MWDDKERAKLDAVQLEASVIGNRVKREIRPKLQPIGHAVSPFWHTVQRVVRHGAAGEVGLLASVRRIVIVPDQVHLPRTVDHCVVDLNFVRLRERDLREGDKCRYK